MGLRQRAAEDREVLGEDVHQAPIDPAVAGDDAVARILLLGEAELGGPVGDEAVQLDEAPLIEQQIEPLPRGELSLLVLLGDAGGAATLLGLGLAMMEIVEEIAGG